MASNDQTKIEPQPNRKHTGGARKGSKHALTHGLNVLKHAVNGLGNRVIDRRTVTGKALAKWRADLIQDLGGNDAISTQQSAIIDLAVKSKLLLDSIDVWLLTQPSLINMRKRALLPVVVQRQQLADGLARYLMTLGLKRIAKDADTPPWEKYGNRTDETNGSAAQDKPGDTQDGQDEESQPDSDSATASNGVSVAVDLIVR